MNTLSLTFKNTIDSEVSPKPIKNFFIGVGTFLYETPLWVVASLVIGAALFVFFPPFSAPFLAVAGGTLIGRATLRILEIYYPKDIKNIREELYELQKQYPYVQYIAFAVSLVAAVFFPIVALFIALPLGFYKGCIVEIDILKYKQHVEGEEIKRPSYNKLNILTHI